MVRNCMLHTAMYTINTLSANPLQRDQVVQVVHGTLGATASHSHSCLSSTLLYLNTCMLVLSSKCLIIRE